MFAGNEDDGEDSEHGEGGLEERERRFPTLEQQENSLGDGDGMSSGGRKITVQDLIAQRYVYSSHFKLFSLITDCDDIGNV